MCGGANKAAKAAQQQDAARQAGIQNAIGQINAIYNSPQRQQQYDDFQRAIQQRNLLQLNQQQTIANRNLNFAMARSGMTGGSADADSAATQERLYNEGLLKGQNAAMQAAASLRASDQQSKQNLIALAESGLDATNASNQALDSLRSNIQSSMAQSVAQDIGDAFAGLGSYFADSQRAKQMRQVLVNPTPNGLYQNAWPQNYSWLSGSQPGMNYAPNAMRWGP